MVAQAPPLRHPTTHSPHIAGSHSSPQRVTLLRRQPTLLDVESTSSSSRSPESRRARNRRGRIIAPLVLAAMVLIAWQVTTASGAVDDFFLPAPGEVLARLWSDLTGPALSYAWPTLQAALGGSLLALVVAVPLGMLISSSSIARTALEPYIAGSQALPAVAVAPLLVLWLGYDLAPVVVLCALMVFFPILVSTVHGLTHVDRDVVAAARVDGANGLTLLRHILLPLALPAILAGVRNGFTVSITGAIVGEIVTGGDGMGLLLATRAGSNDTTGLFSTLVLLGAFAISVYIAVGILQRRAADR